MANIILTNYRSKLKYMKAVYNFLFSICIILLLTSQQGLASGLSWKNAELEKANTAKDVDYLTIKEKQVIQLINLARLDGSKFAQVYLPEYLQLYEELYGTPQEKNAYYSSLVRDLNKVKRLPLLYPNKELFLAAEFHAVDMGANIKTGHKSSDGTSFGQRIDRYVKTSYSAIAENCSYGSESALEIVVILLIDDGISSLGHRKNLLNQKYNNIGVAVRPHRSYGMNCVMDFGAF